MIVLLHLGMIPAAYFAAFLLRFDWAVPEPYLSLYWETLLLLVPIRLACLALFRLLNGWWRHVGMKDLVDLARAVTLSSAVFLAALFISGRLEGFPRSILILDWGIALFVLGGVRFCVRALREGRAQRQDIDRRATPALVIGAGEAAERLLRQLMRGGGEFRAIGLVDDDRTKQRMHLHGVPVVGSTDRLQTLVTRYGAKLLVIAIPSAGREEMKRIVDRCLETKIEFRIVPPLHELLDGTARISQLRKVEVEDLLGRDTVSLSLDNVRGELAGRTVLVTGAAGSIGSELVRQVGALGPSRLILLDQAESPLYFLLLDTLAAYPGLEVIPIIADVAEPSRIASIFSEYRPDFVLHAAAYKHVPMMESNVIEAVRTNVLGTLIVASAAAKHGARRFILISTDKAVYPSSVMGASKRSAERVVLGHPDLRASDTDFRAVRFGNVLGSHGSVVPLFRRQLAAGGPLTVTHPDVTRYFMTIPEAVGLVLQAAVLPDAAGRISMLEMGDPVRIVELAENLVRLSGLEPYRDVPIVFTGLRPGEKVHEDLMSTVEGTVPTSVEKIRIVETDEVEGRFVRALVGELREAVNQGAEERVLADLMTLVPECVSPLRDRAPAEIPDAMPGEALGSQSGGRRGGIVATAPVQ